MSQFDDDDSKPWTEHDLKEAIRRINAGEINFKEAEDYYGISPRTIHRQRAIENMRAQLNPEKAKKAKANPSSSTKKDITVLRKPVDISCASINDVVTLLDTGTEEVKQLLNYECDLIYECKVCKNLFRSLVNFISHKRVYCCDMYSVLHTRTDDGENGSETNELQTVDKIKSKENVKEFTAKPFRITCRKDLTSVLKRITSFTEFAPTEPILKIEHLENSPNAFQQTLVNCQSSDIDDTNKSVPEQAAENVQTSPEAESKTESTAAASKIPEKPVPANSSSSANSSSYVAEKRFRCPVCAVNFTIKKSVMRHLKAVHNQSPEQMERLKPRIQMHYVRRKTGTAENKISSEKKSSSAVNKSKPEKDQIKSNWEKICASCNRLFTNRNSFAAHSRSCNRLSLLRKAANQESDVDSSRTSLPSRRSLQPVVSLTPLPCPLTKPEKTGDPVSVVTSIPTQPDSPNKKPTSAATPKKVAASLPALSSTSSSTCKKIGIQVRMNYGKANANPATSTNVSGSAPTSTFPSTPISVATSSSSTQSSANNSRRSSFAAPTARSEDQTNSQSTRSGNGSAVLARVVETLLGKKSIEEEQTTTTATTLTTTAATAASVTVTFSAAPKSSPSSDTKTIAAEVASASQASAVCKKRAKNKVTLLCEDCRVSYALDEFRCGTSGSSGGNAGRTFRCALGNCDFKCNDKRQLLPHLSGEHAAVADSELARVHATFIAECRGTQNECHSAAKKKNVNDKTDASATTFPRKASLPSSNTAVSGSQSGAVSKTNQQQAQPPTKALQPTEGPQLSKAQPLKPVSQLRLKLMKRKLGAVMSSPTPTAKRKPLNVKQSSMSDNELSTLKTEPEKVAQSVSAVASAPVAVKRENSIDDDSTRATQAPVVVKRSKKAPAAGASVTISAPSKMPPAENKNRSFPRIKLKQTPEKPLVNGIGLAVTSSSSDEENDLPLTALTVAQTTSSKTKGNMRNLVASELRPTKTPPSSTKVVNCHELSSSSSTPDSDLDPSTLTEENLKKSIMTIIFGKDMPTEKVEEREKSPTSSCTSSDSGKEKRYSVRIAKQSTGTKSILPAVDCRDEKVTKIAVPNKVKATR